MAGAYTERDLLRAAKQVAAACQATFDAHTNMAMALGELLGIMAELNGEPPGMSPAALRIDALIGAQAAAYDAIVDAIQNGI